MMRVMISMMCCLIVFGCQSGIKVVPPIGQDLAQEAGIPIVDDGSGWLPIGAYLVLLIAVCWLTWREFRGSTTKSD